MEELSKILKKKIQLSGRESTFLPSTPNRKSEAEIFNDLPGKLQGYDCQKCKNKGIFYLMQGNELVCCECECMKIRRSVQRIKASGIEEAMQRQTLKTFTTEEDYQKKMLTLAVDFIKQNGIAFFLGGQIGCGKTHICTGISGYYLKHGKEVRYIQWRDDVPRLKAMANTEDYSVELDRLKRIEVLYIDDLFKTRDNTPPTAADINIAFDIINYRYLNSGLITIISCQQTFTELLKVDEAIASRIAEMCGKFSLSIGKDVQKNYRLRKAKIEIIGKN